MNVHFVEVNIHIFIQNGCSPLYAASQGDHVEVVDILLKNGADHNLACNVWRPVCS